MKRTYGQHPLPTHTIAHLSDPHLLAHGARQYDVVDPEAGLVAALERLRHLDPVPQALLFTGDLADKGEPAAYARLREIVEPVAADFGAQVIWTMGNHDERAAYSAGLFAGASEEPQDAVYDVAGLRVVALDSSVPGWHHGELSSDQLAWLADVLATPAPHGTVIALHHPPIPIPTMEVAAVIELADQHLLADVVRGTDVRLVAGGHFHYTSWSSFASIPVSVASATCYTSDPAPNQRLVSGVDAHQAFTLLHFYADQVVHTVVPVASAPEVTGFPAAMLEQFDALTPEERHDLMSRKDSPFNSGAMGFNP